MQKFKPILKNALKESVFGALFTLWTAPIDEPKLKLPKESLSKKEGQTFLSKNLIIEYRP